MQREANVGNTTNEQRRVGRPDQLVNEQRLMGRPVVQLVTQPGEIQPPRRRRKKRRAVTKKMFATSGTSTRQGSNCAPKAWTWDTEKFQTRSCSCLWTLDNFLDTFEFLTDSVTSCVFRAAPSSFVAWRMYINPTDSHCLTPSVPIPVYLQLVSSRVYDVRAQVRLTLLDDKNRVIKTEADPNVVRFRQAQVFTAMSIKGSMFQTSSSGTISLLCQVCYLDKVDKQADSVQAEPVNPLQQDIAHLWEQTRTSDLTLSVQGRLMLAHTAVLAGRSAVFMTMLQHLAPRSIHSKVEIPDLKPETLEELLRFIYTGKSANLQNMAADLVVAADRFDMSHLKSLCEESLVSSLTAQNVCGFYRLAHCHNLPHLKESAVSFIRRSPREVLVLPEWTVLMEDHPELAIPNMLPPDIWIFLKSALNRRFGVQDDRK